MTGTTLDGTYRIDALIGTGGMSHVYKAWDLRLHRWVAIKVTREGFGALTQREGRALGQMAHPNIVNVYTQIEKERQLFTVMEFVEGRPLSEFTGLAPKDGLAILEQVLEALKFAHGKHIIHRDLKPANIVVRRENDGVWHAKVLDFGIAKFQDPEHQETFTVGSAGTVNYMSPEQILTPREIDYRSDIYSLGQTFYEVFAGQLPFERGSSSGFQIQRQIIERIFDPPSRFNPDLPVEIDTLIARAMAKKPDHRYQDACEMLERVVQIRAAFEQGTLNSHPEATRRVGADEPDTARALSRPLVRRMTIALASLVLVLTASWIAYDFLGRPDPSPEIANAVTTRGDSPGTHEPPPDDTIATLPPAPHQGSSTEGEDPSSVQSPTEPEVTPPMGQLSIQSTPSGATIRIAGRPLPEKTPITAYSLSPGSYDLEISSAPWYQSHRRRITVAPNETLRLNEVNLVQLGRLNITSPSDAEIWYNGSLFGRTASGPLDMPVGSHEITIKKQGFKDQTLPVSIVHRQTLPMDVALEAPMGIMSIALKPSGQIIVDGIERGNGVGAWENSLPLGRHDIRVITAVGRWDSTVVLDRDSRIEFDFNDVVDVRVTSSRYQGAEIFVDLKSTGRYTNSSIILAPGFHEVYIKHDASGYRSATKVVQLHAGRMYRNGVYYIEFD